MKQDLLRRLERLEQEISGSNLIVTLKNGTEKEMSIGYLIDLAKRPEWQEVMKVRESDHISGDNGLLAALLDGLTEEGEELNEC